MLIALLILSSVAGLIGGAVAWMVGASLLTSVIVYALLGNVLFALLSLRSLGREDHDLDIQAEIGKDLVALEEHAERLAARGESITLFRALRLQEQMNTRIEKRARVFHTNGRG